MKYKLTKEEKDIEKKLGDYQPVKRHVKNIIDNDMKKLSKKKTITLRVNENDLRKIKDMAEHEGMPYQTLIGSLLHKFASDRLCDREEAMRLIQADR